MEHNKDLEIIHPDMRFINARQKKHGLVRLKQMVHITTYQLKSSCKRPFLEEEFGSDDDETSKKRENCFMEKIQNLKHAR